MSKIAIVYYSASGHTHEMAEAVQAGAASIAGCTVELVRILDADIQNGRWKNEAAMVALNSADAIIFGTPTYMGGVSAQVKAFIDACGGIWYQQAWKNKIAAGFTHSQGLSGDKLNTLQSLFINAMQHSMIWVGLGQMVGGITPESINRLSSYTGAMAATFPANLPLNSGDKETARLLGVRVAEVVKSFGK